MSDSKLNHIDEVMTRCLHCGLCLPVCPTYALTNKEQSSPRGRIRLIRSLYDRSLQLDDAFVDEMYFCLDCQACETACPAGVQYGVLVEDARNTISKNGRDPFSLQVVKRFFLNAVLRTPGATRIWGRFLQFYRRSGLQEAVDQSNILALISPAVQAKHALLPRASDTFFDEHLPEFLPAYGKRRGKVGFLKGCIMNIAFADIHRDAVEVIRSCGYDVVIPSGQACCGSLHAHNGEAKEARRLAEINIGAFGKHDLDAIVIDSAGCGAFMKEYAHVFANDPKLAEAASVLSRRVKDINEFLSRIDLPVPRNTIAKRVTYHDACHLVHSQKISRQPRDLIRAIPGIELIELPESTWCCGSAGIYNIVRYEDSMKMLDRKMQNIALTEAEIILTANPGCHLQLQYGIKKYGLNMKVMHPVSLLRESLKAKRE